MSSLTKTHRAPWECLFPEKDWGKCLPGKPPKSDKEYFEILSLCILQSGLGWGMIRRIWPRMRKSFYNFEVKRLANAKLGDILKNPNVIKNERKIKAILKNAKKFRKIQNQYGSFQKFIVSLGKLKKKEAIKQLTEKFEHLGEYSTSYFLHSIGFEKK